VQHRRHPALEFTIAQEIFMNVPHTSRCPGAPAALLALLLPLAAHAHHDHDYLRAAAPEGAIEHILVINLENGE